MNQQAAYNMYFIAILCPSQIDDKILQFKQWMKEQFGCITALKSPAHITLVPPFWLQAERKGALLQALQEFKSDIGELEIQLDGFSHFGKRVLFVQVNQNPGLEEIKIQTENHFIASSADFVKKDNRPFHPHVTIATRDMKPSDFEKAFDYFSCKEFKMIFQTKTLSLLKLNIGRWEILTEKNW